MQYCLLEIECPSRLPLAKGRILAGSDLLQEVDLRFECDDGYELIGLANVTCLRGGNWSGDQPECQSNYTFGSFLCNDLLRRSSYSLPVSRST